MSNDKRDLGTILNEEFDKFMELDEEQQEEKLAESVMQLIDILPSPENEKEFSKFMELMENPPITGETDEEIMKSFLELSKTNPEFFAQAIAFSALLSDADTIANIARTVAPKQSKVESISKAELDAIHQADEDQKLDELRDMLSQIPLEDVLASDSNSAE